MPFYLRCCLIDVWGESEVGNVETRESHAQEEKGWRIGKVYNDAVIGMNM